MLQAEEDRDQVRRMLAERAREKELLGKETRIYNSDRYVLLTSRMNWRDGRWLTRDNRFVRPTYAAVPGQVTK